MSNKEINDLKDLFSAKYVELENMYQNKLNERYIIIENESNKRILEINDQCTETIINSQKLIDETLKDKLSEIEITISNRVNDKVKEIKIENDTTLLLEHEKLKRILENEYIEKFNREIENYKNNSNQFMENKVLDLKNELEKDYSKKI